IRRQRYSYPLNFLQDSRRHVLEAIEDRLLRAALQLELRASLRLLAWSPDVIEGLRFKLAGRLDPEYAYSPRWVQVRVFLLFFLFL
ncbi:enoyl- hydratase isomerase family protein, partial [Cystoisospora suis]